MSSKENQRRKISSFVMKTAWKLMKSTLHYELPFSIVLKLAWSIIKGKVRKHYTKIVGISFGSRQKVLKRLITYPSNEVVINLIRQPDNPFNKNAIQVMAQVIGKGKAVLGYLSNNLATVIAPLIELGHKIIVTSFDITGGFADRLYGCNLCYLIA